MSDVKFIEQGHEILGIFKSEGYTEPHDFIANVARTCYQSESKGADADERLVRSLVKMGHHAMLEHSFMSVRFVTDRAIANEIVRHRLFSFAQESTRYCNYDNRGFEFVLPNISGGGLMDGHKLDCVKRACMFAAEQYEEMLECGMKPEIARAVLPLCTATRIVVSGNMREWRHFFELRCDIHAHPQIRELANGLLDDVKQRVPVLFEDIQP